jgi:preprotein translocase subunit YajC
MLGRSAGPDRLGARILKRGTASRTHDLPDNARPGQVKRLRGYAPAATGARLRARQARERETGKVWMGILGSGQLLLPLVFIAVIYFMMIVPNQKKQKKWQEMLSNLKNGDKVTTNGGIRGVVISVKDDAIQLRIAPDNVKLEFAKNAIASVSTDD